MPTHEDIQAWMDAEEANGGGTVDLGANTYQITGQIEPRQRVEVHGHGAATVLEVAEGVFPINATGNVEDWAFTDMRLEGPGPTTPQSAHGVRFTSGIRYRLERLHIKGFPSYGIGFQAKNEGDRIADGVTRDILIECCGQDGFDWKNSWDQNRNNLIDNVVCRYFGQNRPEGGSAAFDLRGLGFRVVNCIAEYIGHGQAGFRARPGEHGSGNGLGAYFAQFGNCLAIGPDGLADGNEIVAHGYSINAPGVMLSNSQARGCDRGFTYHAPDTQTTGCAAIDCHHDGFNYAEGADRGLNTGCVSIHQFMQSSKIKHFHVEADDVHIEAGRVHGSGQGWGLYLEGDNNMADIGIRNVGLPIKDNGLNNTY